MGGLLVFIALAFCILAGIVPTILYVFLVSRFDRYEKEPLRLLAAAFLWGALPAAVLSVILENAFDLPIRALSQSYSQIISASVVAPLVEESVKGLALLGLFGLAHSEFDDVLDGIIYGSLVGLGFAMTENIFYFFRAAQQNTLPGWSVVVLGRAVAFGFNHAMFTAFTGIGLGLARYSKSVAGRWLLILSGLAMAMMAHFCHNFFLAAGDLCLLSFLVDWFGVFVVLVIILLMWGRERAWLRTQLAEEAALGVLTPLQAETIASRRERFKRGWYLLGISGLAQLRLWRTLADTASELAFKKHQLATMGEEKGNSATIAALRIKVLRLRQRLGDQVALSSRVCSRCGRSTTNADAAFCAYCGGPWVAG